MGGVTGAFAEALTFGTLDDNLTMPLVCTSILTLLCNVNVLAC